MAKNKKWFIKTRGSYLPRTWQSLMLYVAYLVYIIWVLVYIIRLDYNFWLAIFILVPNWVAACAVVSWIASKKS
ncbi:MAG: hypothetical protein WCP03_03850 [Candidatus Saccharibacteria bacterium]